MKALTLTQPWATLMVAPRLDTGLPSKRIESRSWAPHHAPVVVHGWRLGLHAARHAATPIRHAILHRPNRFTREFTEPYKGALIACGYSYFDPWHQDYHVELTADNAVRAAEGKSVLKPLPLGALIGTITLDTWKNGSFIKRLWEEGDISDLEYSLGSYDERDEPRFGWVTSTAVEISAPIRVHGYQKLWDIPTAALHELGLQLRDEALA